MLERMLASESAEAEIIKVQYYSWKNQRGNTTSFSNKKLIGDAGKYNRESKLLQAKRDFSNNHRSK
jgi:hypothetical protein